MVVTWQREQQWSQSVQDGLRQDPATREALTFIGAFPMVTGTGTQDTNPGGFVDEEIRGCG